ncbi:ribonuclease Z [Herbidospora sp. NEAU-GS84]|uniref:Ribonuclease Z n=1 Tax=Herbidospora solisilvae TaxID=2696284 RepID=A0A7C9MXI7_9ACTN|nr:ribonuclease Z [Herbidospora solisilvae]NAS23151.1 ribonuclease Z [Herbidospora solisilvae]
MSNRELIVLGTSSAVPTRSRNHNGYFLRWDDQGFLFDPGEGTQRQMRLAGVSAHDVTTICVTHFHGDHCLGLPGVIQRIARDGVPHEVRAVYPASGEAYWRRLRHATAFADTSMIMPCPVEGEVVALPSSSLTLTARPLSHPVDAYGYRLDEPSGRRMIPAELARHGIGGARVGELQREGRLGEVTLEQVSEPRPGQSMAFVMDTRLCDNVHALAEGVDLLVIESTFLTPESALAHDYGHLTAAQAGQVAADAGVRKLVLTHFSERYGHDDERRFADEAAKAYSGDIVVARDLMRVPVPRRGGRG